MNQPLRLLLVEKSVTEADILINMLLYAGFQVVSRRVCVPEEIDAALAESPYDLVILDCSPPLQNILHAVEKVRRFSGLLPLIVVSEEINAEEAAELRRAGANDYVRKSNMARLAVAVERERKKNLSGEPKQSAKQNSPEAFRSLRKPLRVRNPYRKR